MENPTPLEKLFDEMLANRQFVGIEPFLSAESWEKLTENERRLLGLVFVAQGKQQLKKGEQIALENFARASQVAPHSADVFYAQAEAFASQIHNVRCLSEACKLLEATIKLDPDNVSGWMAWGSVLVRLASIHGDPAYCQDALAKFQTAEEKAKNISETQKAVLYWRWGACWSILGQISGEPFDFQMALNKYQVSASLGLTEVDFLNDYGNITAELAMLMGKGELYNEAARLFHRVVEITPDHFNGWLNLACCYQRMYLYNKEDVSLQHAIEAFSQAEKLDSNNFDLWLNWARLLLLAGKWKHSIEFLQESYSKFVQADACEPNNPFVLSTWAEAQMIAGAYSENVDLLRAAEEKLIHSLEIAPDNSDIWGLYGTCLTELGRYFSEESFYLRAIEKFRYGLTLSPKNPLLWYGQSLAHFAIGDLHGDVEMVEQSVKCCAKVIEFGGEPYPQFWNDWGISLMKLAELTQDQNAIELAIEKFERAFGWEPGSKQEDFSQCDKEWLYNYGCAYDFLGDFTQNSDHHERAVQVLTYIVQLDSGHSNARYNLALALANLGEDLGEVEYFLDALDHFELLLNAHHEDEYAWNDWGMTLLNLGRILHEPLNPEQSRRCYEAAEEKFIHAVALGSVDAFYNLACLYSLLGNYGAAMHYIERAEISDALPSIDEVLHDEWLEGVRNTPEFRNFIALLSQRPER